MEEWLATASVESLKRFHDLTRFALTMRTTTTKPTKPKMAQEVLGLDK